MKNKELDLFKVLIPAIDNNMKELYTVASEDGKKDIKGDLWNLNRYISNIQGTRTQQEVAVFKTNEFYNKNWNVLGGTNHINLQWQLLCISGNTGKKEFHPWQGFKKKSGSNDKAIKLLEQLNPNMKTDEVELLARISTKKELKQLAEDHEINIKL